MREKLVQHHRPHRAALDFDHDAHAGAFAGLVAQPGNAGNALVVDQLGDLLDQLFLADCVRDFGDDDLFAAVLFDDVRLGADFDAAVAGLVELAHRIAAADDRSGREVRAGQILHQLVDGRFGIVQKADGRVDHFTEVVRRNAGRHADADAGGPVDQELRIAGRKHFRLGFGFVEVRDHVDRIFVDIGQQLFREALHTALGIPARRGGVAVDVAEVALPLDQRIAHGKVLRETNQRIIDRGIAVRMVFTHHFADDAGALDGGVRFAEPELAHRVQDAAVHRLETVTHIRDGTADVDAERILQICSMHDIFNIYLKIPGSQIAHINRSRSII